MLVSNNQCGGFSLFNPVVIDDGNLGRKAPDAHGQRETALAELEFFGRDTLVVRTEDDVAAAIQVVNGLPVVCCCSNGCGLLITFTDRECELSVVNCRGLIECNRVFKIVTIAFLH